ncbi:MAG: hypothetical protein ISS23_02335 [Nanoarchaeota archaeon]|nr:hypothetical protein [Nanoarchaeota archaeon]
MTSLPLFFKILKSSEDSHAVINGRIYKIKEDGGGIGEAHLIGIKLFLHESAEISYLEKDYFTKNKKELNELAVKLKKSAIDKKDKLKRSQIKSNNELEKLVSKHKFLNFFVNEVYPHFIVGEVDRYENQIVPNKKRNNKNTPNPQKNKTSDLFTKGILGGKDIIVSVGQVYELKKRKNKEGNYILLNNFIYEVGGRFDSLTNLIEKYCSILVGKVEENADDETKRLSCQLKDNENKTGLFSKCLNKTEYSVNDTGFKKLNDNSYYIYKIIAEAYNLIDKKTDKKYQFPPCKVAVKVDLEPNDNIKVDIWPIVLEKYTHPFLRSKNVAKQEICIGSKEYKEKYPKELDRYDAALKVKAAIDEGVTVLKEGYFGKPNAWEDLANFPEMEI